jgi:thiosulfate/3-mercaptopyruvate sulfurtransferase
VSFETLIEASQLFHRIADPQLRIFDATAYLDPHPDKKSGYVPRSGKKEWGNEHIPGARHIDLVSDFADRSSPLPFTMLTPERFCSRMGELGVSENCDVVIYSSASPMWATRLWWMFRSIGFARCAVLDGGLAQWKAKGYLTGEQVNDFPKTTLSPKPSSLGWATKAELIEFLKSPSKTCVIDALSPRDYAGENSKYGGRGHIPGSHNVFHFSLLREDGTFLPVESLKKLFETSRALESDRAICYCGGGIASTMTAMALYLCGHRNVAVYDGSMLEWAMDRSLPLKMGAIP